MQKLRFHVLGLSHTKTTASFSCCAFTQKARLLCRMLTELGHDVIHYGVEGSDPVCTEHVTVLKHEDWATVHEAYDYRVGGFQTDCDNLAYNLFTNNCIEQITRRSKPNDFLLCTFGLAHAPIAKALPRLVAVESGVGYRHTFAPWRIFDSYAWMHFLYGTESTAERTKNPSWYDAVIPPAFDLDEFPFRAYKDDYFVHIGRPQHDKGRQIAIDTCKRLGVELVVAGQGDKTVPTGVRHLGTVNIKERAALLGGARAVFVPSHYAEPFGMVTIEANACGTPVLTSDWGAFPEIVQHGVTGYRCRTMEQFVWAAKQVDTLQPALCRKHAEQYSIERVAGMYDEYFHTLHGLFDGSRGWYEPERDRTQLDWLNQDREEHA